MGLKVTTMSGPRHKTKQWSVTLGKLTDTGEYGAEDTLGRKEVGIREWRPSPQALLRSLGRQLARVTQEP